MPVTTPNPVKIHPADTELRLSAEFLFVALAAALAELLDDLLDEVLVALADDALVLAGAAAGDVDAVLPARLEVAEATSCA